MLTILFWPARICKNYLATKPLLTSATFDYQKMMSTTEKRLCRGIQSPVQKSRRLFAEGFSAILTSRSAYKKICHRYNTLLRGVIEDPITKPFNINKKGPEVQKFGILSFGTTNFSFWHEVITWQSIQRVSRYCRMLRCFTVSAKPLQSYMVFLFSHVVQLLDLY